jgi:metallopeptidase MepB
MDEFNIEASMREDIFQLVDAAWKREAEKKELDGESKRLLQKEWKSYVRNGLGIEKGPKRDRFKEIKKRLSQVCWGCCIGGSRLTAIDPNRVPEEPE